MPADWGFILPQGMDWGQWVTRWDRMQERYLLAREERFRIIAELIGALHGSPACLVDLGCGTGSLMHALLTAFPKAEVWGLDFDPTLLALAGRRLEAFGPRAQLRRADLRVSAWAEELPGQVEAVVSATALHWLTPEQLAALYEQIRAVLAPGGVFLNADHVGSACPALQEAWRAARDAALRQQPSSDADDWDGFWRAYGEALGIDIAAFQARFAGAWLGSDDGLPLAWHLDRLRATGFVAADCFWRGLTDAIYGGVRA